MRLRGAGEDSRGDAPWMSTGDIRGPDTAVMPAEGSDDELEYASLLREFEDKVAELGNVEGGTSGVGDEAEADGAALNKLREDMVRELEARFDAVTNDEELERLLSEALGGGNATGLQMPPVDSLFAAKRMAAVDPITAAQALRGQSAGAGGEVRGMSAECAQTTRRARDAPAGSVQGRRWNSSNAHGCRPACIHK